MAVRRVSKRKKTDRYVDPVLGDRLFYVGSRDIANGNSSWATATLDTAINDAKIKCSEEGTRQIVVQIVAVVEPAKAPVIVRKL